MEKIVNIATPHNGDIEAQYVGHLINMLQSSPYAVKVNLRCGCYVAKNRNALLDKCDADYLFFIDSDMAFPPDVLNKLMALDKDIAGALYFHRNPPHIPLVYTKMKKGKGFDPILNYPDKPFECDAVGTGLMLIKKKVIKHFKGTYPFNHIRVSDEFELGDDLSFCKRAKEAGFEIWCDPTIPTGHITRQAITQNDYLAYKQLKDEQDSRHNNSPS